MFILKINHTASTALSVTFDSPIRSSPSIGSTAIITAPIDSNDPLVARYNNGGARIIRIRNSRNRYQVPLSGGDLWRT